MTHIINIYHKYIIFILYIYINIIYSLIIGFLFLWGRFPEVGLIAGPKLSTSFKFLIGCCGLNCML